MGGWHPFPSAYADMRWFRGVFILSFYPYGMRWCGMVGCGAILLGCYGIAGDIRGYRGNQGYDIYGILVVML